MQTHSIFNCVKDPIPTSILRMAPQYEAVARQIFAMVLNWMALTNAESDRDRRRSIETSIVNGAKTVSGMENEIYLQLLKQTRGPSERDQERNAWKLFSIVAKEVSCTDVRFYVTWHGVEAVCCLRGFSNLYFMK